MFVCVSLNPAVDKRLRLARLQPGRVNRATEVSPAPGGKAAHVAMVLRSLGADPLWLGFAGGSTGAALVEDLQAMSIRVKSITTESSTRMNLEILEDDGGVTEILEPGHAVTEQELQEFQGTYISTVQSSGERAIVILSGSLPPGAPSDYYASLVELGHHADAHVLLDVSGDPLQLALKARPDFAKPNQEEAESLSGAIIDGPQSAAAVLKTILRDTARSAAISLGANGLVWRSGKDSQTLYAQVPQLKARSAVGSGDATMAGFAFAAERGLSPADALRLAAACGAANCLADGPGRGRAEDVERLKDEIRIEVLR